MKLLLNVLEFFTLLLLALLLTLPTKTVAETIDVTDFGAIPNDGEDDTQAIQDAIEVVWTDWTEAHGSGVLYFPQGTYILSSPIVFDEEGNNQNVYRSIVGDGSGLSKISVSNSEGFFSWTKSNFGLYFRMEGMTIEVSTGTSCDYGIRLQQGYSGNRYDRHYIIKDVVFKSNDNMRYFNYGIDIKGGTRALIKNVLISGRLASAAGGLSESWVGNTGIKLEDSYGPTIENCKIWGYRFGISHKSTVDPGAEGGEIRNCVANAYIGIDIYSMSDEPGLQIINCHTNTGNKGVRINGRKRILISGCLFYNEEDESYIDIEFDHVKEATIMNCQFVYSGNENRISIMLKDTTYSGAQGGWGNYIITNNLFAHNGIGVYVYSNDFKSNSSILSNNIFSEELDSSVVGYSDIWGIMGNNVEQ